MKKQKIFMIVATDLRRGIGKEGTLPWNLKKDMEHFKKITTTTVDPKKQNAVVMGRKTWESIPEKYRPLEDRRNFVISRDNRYRPDGAFSVRGINKLLEKMEDDIETIFIIGGGLIYSMYLEHPQLDGVYITEIDEKYDCDTFFPEIPDRFENMEVLGEAEEKGVSMAFLKYT